MSTWTPEQLNSIERAGELTIATRRPDGTFRNPVIVWFVRIGDEVYLRSVRGSAGGWYRGLQADPFARIKVGSLSQDVDAHFLGHELDGPIDAAYRAKYGGGSAVQAINAQQAQDATVRLSPAGS